MHSRRSRRARAAALATITLTAATALFAAVPASAAPAERVSAISTGFHGVTTAGNADAIQDLYVAYFNRSADAASLEFWQRTLDGGGIGIVDIANAFAATYADSDAPHPGTVSTLYQSLFGRTPSFLSWSELLAFQTNAEAETKRWESVAAEQAKADAASALAQAASAEAATARAALVSSQVALAAAVRVATTAVGAASAARAAADAAQADADADAVNPNPSPALQETADLLAAAAVVAETSATTARDAETVANAAVTSAVAADAAATQKVANMTPAATSAQAAAAQAKAAYSAADAATSPAVPATLPAGDSTVVTASTGTTAGRALLLIASGFAPGTEVAVGIHSDPLAIAPITADASGLASTLFLIPDSFTGDHSLVAVGTGADGAPRTVRLDVVVSAPAAVANPVTVSAAAAGSAVLAETGIEPAFPLSAGLLLLIAGSFVVYRRHMATVAGAGAGAGTRG